MNSASKIFYGLSAFFVVMTVFYFVATGLVSDPGSRVGIEWAGGTALALATLLSLMLAAYLHLTDSKSDIAPTTGRRRRSRTAPVCSASSPRARSGPSR